MRFARISIENYKALRDIAIPFSQFVCLIGQNNSGKSSLLQAILLLIEGKKIQLTSHYDPARDVVSRADMEDITEDDLALIAGRPHTRGDDNWCQFSFSWDRAGNGKDTPCFLGSNPPLQFNLHLSVVSLHLSVVSCQWSVAGFSGPERIYRVFLVAPVKAFRDDHGLRGSMSATAVQGYQGRVPPLAMGLHPVGVNPMAAR
jgi:energy-coupling factor transporter ATP-binding protein EcfA2